MTKLKTEKRFQNILRRYNSSLAVIVSVILAAFGFLLLIIASYVETKVKLAAILTQVATVGISSGVIGFAYEFVLRRNFLLEVQESVNQQLNQIYNQIGSLNSNGIQSIYTTMPIADINMQISEAKNEIKILETWIGNFIALEEELEKAINRGLRVKILLLNHESGQAKYRSLDLRNKEDHVKNQIIINLSQLARLNAATNYSTLFEVRKFDATPVMSLYWFDDSCFLGLFWRNKTAARGHHIEIKTDKTSLGKLVESHFVDLWRFSESVDLNEFLDTPATEQIDPKEPTT